MNLESRGWCSSAKKFSAKICRTDLPLSISKCTFVFVAGEALTYS